MKKTRIIKKSFADKANMLDVFVVRITSIGWVTIKLSIGDSDQFWNDNGMFSSKTYQIAVSEKISLTDGVLIN